MDHVNEIAPYFEEKLEELMKKYDCITARRGKGLMQGLVIGNGVKVGDITKEALNHGLIVISAGSDVLRMVPPLIIEKQHIDEFVQKLSEHINNREKSQLLLVKIASAFYSSGQYEESSKFYNFVINKYDITDKEIQISLIQAMAHIDLNKSEEIRRKIDETPIDLSNEHMNSLLTELFLKFKKPAQQNN